MRVLRIADSIPPTLVYASAPQPSPGPGELLIQVHAAGVTPTELEWYPTTHTKSGDPRPGAIPGHEFSGVVAAAGDNSGTLGAGRAVFGMNDWFADGAMAEYCVAPLLSVAPKPARLSHVEAAAAPIGALTAWQGLFDHAKLKPGERILIHGAAGAVGVYIVQLARLHGAYVIATASAANAGFVSTLGAAEVVDYRAARFEQRVRDVDVVFDTVGGETLERSWSVLKPGGRMVTIASGGENASDARIKQAFFIVEPRQEDLLEIAALLDAGKLQPVVDTAIPWSRAADAFDGRAPRQGHGKMVVAVANEG